MNPRLCLPWRQRIAALGWLLWCALSITSGQTAEPTPYLGTPLSIPERFEAEHYDLGGEGVGYHKVDYFGGFSIAPTSGRSPFPFSRRADEYDFLGSIGTSLNVILVGTDWLNYTIYCESEGYYSVQLHSQGTPRFYYYRNYPPDNPPCDQVTFGSVEFHIELDGHNVSVGGLSGGDTNAATTRIWISPGLHQLRVVVDAVSNFLWQGCLSIDSPWGNFTYWVDWIQVVPSSTQFRLANLAGGVNGFLDGQGSEARFGLNPVLIGEFPSGELVVQDTANEAFRLISRDGRVRTLAGHPGNAVRDGNGTEAGFGGILQTLVTPEGYLLVLETDGATAERIRQVDGAGKVSTLYSGRPEVQLPEGTVWPPTRIVALTQIAWSGAHRLEAMGSIPQYGVLASGWAPFGEWVVFSIGHAQFRFAEGLAIPIEVGYGPPPPQDPHNLGGGYRLAGSSGSLLVHEEPADFFQQVLPNWGLTSGLRATDGTLFGVRDLSRIYRLVPDLSLAVRISGQGTVDGVPATTVPPDQQIRLQAVPGSRFTEFVGWSDGNTDNPRLLQLSRDTVLTARFEQRLPIPNGIIPGSGELGSDRSLRFRLFGSSPPYRYRIQASPDLERWTGPILGTETLFGSGILRGDVVETVANETWLGVPTTSARHYFRVQLLDE